MLDVICIWILRMRCSDWRGFGLARFRLTRIYCMHSNQALQKLKTMSKTPLKMTFFGLKISHFTATWWLITFLIIKTYTLMLCFHVWIIYSLAISCIFFYFLLIGLLGNISSRMLSRPWKRLFYAILVSKQNFRTKAYLSILGEQLVCLSIAEGSGFKTLSIILPCTGGFNKS